MDARAESTFVPAMEDDMVSRNPHALRNPHDDGVSMAQPRAAPSIESEKESKQKHHTNPRRTKAPVTLRQGEEDTHVAELEATCDFQTTLEDEDATSGSENGAALSR